MDKKSKKKCDSCGGCGVAGSCSASQGCTACPGRERACGGCAGGCPHAAEFQWDYDDTVLVFSSDMLEEESP